MGQRAGTHQPEFNSQSCCSEALWHQGSYLTSLVVVSSSENRKVMIFSVLTLQVILCKTLV